jgi:hypothetical protein
MKYDKMKKQNLKNTAVNYGKLIMVESAILGISAIPIYIGINYSYTNTIITFILVNIGILVLGKSDLK